MKKISKKFFCILKKISDFILDTIFPKFCINCGQEGKWICVDCVKKIIFIQKRTCPSCNRLNKTGKFCQKCRKKSSLAGIISAAYYDGILKEAIHKFKYEGFFDISHELGKMLSKSVQKNHFGSAILIPVPLHKKRLNFRGYNQSLLLCREIAKKGNFIINKNLIRIKNTKPQIELPGRARRKNIKKAFLWKGGNEIRKRVVLLVDDVYTTGSTLEECAAELKQAGAEEVWGIVLAKV